MPFLRYDDWWIRGFDYPRAQMIFVLAIASLCWIISHQNNNLINLIIAFCLISATTYQLYRILPYTRLGSKQVKDALKAANKDRQLSLMVANVLQTNKEHERVIKVVLETDPDLLLTVETNANWEKSLKKALGEKYPYSVDVPLENLYGMHLFSKRELHNPEIKYRIKDDIPSINCEVKLDDGTAVSLYFLHPMPPSPSEDYASTGRDAEMALVGQEVGQQNRPTIVAGDMNDVAWSHSSRLFRRLSGLLDPRRGRGLVSTFHADYWFARWPLDHAYHSTHFSVAELRRLPNIGSDHFPVFVRLSYEPSTPSEQAQSSDDSDEREARQTIETEKMGEENTVL